MVNENSAQIDVIGSQVHISSLSQAVTEIMQQVTKKQGSYVCLANVHMCMEAIDDRVFAAVLQQAKLVLADGRPIFWAQRLLGASQAQQVRGLDLVLTLCRQMQDAGLRLGIYGGQDDTLVTQLKVALLQQFPDLNIVYAYAPPFRPLTPAEDEVQIAAIQTADVDILLVGLGCPKQEYWMATHQPHLSTVMVGVGAAFDFIAGRKVHAPRVLQLFGLEWLFRLMTEPRRLSGRYLKHNPRFILRFGVQYFRSMISRLSGK
ncbi:MAG: WecB/TagA/CpsF family glycosyltransferase [Gammaproteobacteria bacterium]|nr:WecB/TagA/CpsF family glycosyltransferase [Gammaproteobacteria bacterium]